MSTRVFLVDGHEVFRYGLHALLEPCPEIKIVGEAGDGESALRMVQEFPIDVILMDISIRQPDGIALSQTIHADLPDIKIIILSLHMSRVQIVDGLKAGASGFLSRDCSRQDLLAGISTVRQGNLFLNLPVIQFVVREFVLHAPSEGDSILTDLTEREREVLPLLAEGQSPKQIALSHRVGRKTVEFHRRRIFEKLNLHGASDLTRYAIQHKIIPLSRG